jgi:CheY-like chemotaxis protein
MSENRNPAQKRIVVVDDQPFVARVIQVNLVREQYEVLSFQDPLEVLHRLAELAPDLLILDIGMPVMNGVELCRQIRQTPLGRHLPIMMLTAQGDSANEEDARRAGASAFMTKPFSPRELAATVSQLLACDRGEADHAG